MLVKIDCRICFAWYWERSLLAHLPGAVWRRGWLDMTEATRGELRGDGGGGRRDEVEDARLGGMCDLENEDCKEKREKRLKPK